MPARPARALARAPLRPLALALALAAGCRSAAPSGAQTGAPVAAPGTARDIAPRARATRDAPPPAPPARWQGILGEYGPASESRLVLEQDGGLAVRTRRGTAWGDAVRLEERPGLVFLLPDSTQLTFVRDPAGRVTALDSAAVRLPRRAVGPESGDNLLITPVRPIAELRQEALAATPPAEAGSFRAPDLVELVRLDPTVHLDVRYATAHNFLGTPFYTEARAFLQRPAAEALARASATLRARGYGLLVHDGYRPWYVTRMFWDATPPDKHNFVADPAQGSRHNRGSAVDLSLYELRTGRPVEMVSVYDETSPRAFPNYPGGTSRQRWHRDLLRRAMEAEGFTVYSDEWWHFDHRDWRAYPILNTPFERLGGS